MTPPSLTLRLHAGRNRAGGPLTRAPVVFPTKDHQRFLDRQGAVHARVSADIGQEFGVYLSCPLHEDKIKPF